MKTENDTIAVYYGIVDKWSYEDGVVSLSLCLRNCNGEDIYCDYSIRDDLSNSEYLSFVQSMFLFTKNSEVNLNFLPLTWIGAEIAKNNERYYKVKRVWLDTEMYSA